MSLMCGVCREHELKPRNTYPMPPEGNGTKETSRRAITSLCPGCGATHTLVEIKVTEIRFVNPARGNGAYAISKKAGKVGVPARPTRLCARLSEVRARLQDAQEGRY